LAESAFSAPAAWADNERRPRGYAKPMVRN
jgi:hypothetical protein